MLRFVPTTAYFPPFFTMLHLYVFARIALAAGVALVFQADALAQGLGLKLQQPVGGQPTAGVAVLPVFITADRLEGIGNQEMRAAGEAQLSKGTTSITADRIKYVTETDEFEALGSARLVRDGDVVTGPALRYKIDQAQGVFEQPDYSLAPRKKSGEAPTAISGKARQLEILGEQQFRLSEGTFSTCQPGNEDWYIRFGQLDLDYGRSLGVARSAKVVFMGVPIIATPWLTFSLDNQRKSGFLTPSYGSSDKGGLEVAAPYYWNIAPNRDATFTPRYISKRGLQLGTEFRYLEPTYRGQSSYVVLPDDKTVNQTRWAFNSLHSFDARWVTGGWNVDTVSDNNYYRDLSSQIPLTSLANLNREAYASSGGSWLGDGAWGVTGRVQRYQTLQDPLQPVTVPYARLPQVNLGAVKQVIRGGDFAATAEYVYFANSSQVQGSRTFAYPTFSLPLLTPGAYLTPKLGYNWTQYTLTQNTYGSQNSITRAMPTATVDSGLIFERPTSFGGRDLRQTLEPRLYYVHIPYRNQNNIPLFDTGQSDFNFAQIFSENQFSGKDRVNDANQLTAAVTTRILQPNGQELMRVLIGQQYYFKNQQVTLNPGDVPRTNKVSDLVASAAASVTRTWRVEGAVQYDPQLNQADQVSISTRYQPEVQKVINLGYRYNRNVLNQFEAAGQWPLGGRWFGVGRASYAIKPSSLVEGLAGLEYDGGCWVVRLVAHRFATAVGVQSNAIFLQLELNGLANIGSNPLSLLKGNIGGYSQLNRSADPIRLPSLYN